MNGSATVTIAAPAEAVWALVTDVTRMGEWSPETVKAVWLDGATGPAVGARFKGTNKAGLIRWSTKVRIDECEPGRSFVFTTTAGKHDSTRWSYRFEPNADGGCTATESYEGLWEPAIGKLLFPPKRRVPQLQAGMEQTLARLKAVAERPSS